jgi:hypothetical protein
MGFGVHVHIDPTNLAFGAMLVQNPIENYDKSPLHMHLIFSTMQQWRRITLYY